MWTPNSQNLKELTPGHWQIQVETIHSTNIQSRLENATTTINLKKDLTGEIEMEKKTSVPGEVEGATLRRVNLGRPKWNEHKRVVRDSIGTT